MDLGVAWEISNATIHLYSVALSQVGKGSTLSGTTTLYLGTLRLMESMFSAPYTVSTYLTVARSVSERVSTMHNDRAIKRWCL